MSLQQQPSALVDVNVWLDFYLPHRSGHEAACSFLNAAREHGYQLFYAASSLQTVFYLLILDLKRVATCEGELSNTDIAAIRRIAWGCIDNLRELAVAVGMDEADLWLASKYRTLCWDLEDNTILAAAKRAGTQYIVTNDQQLIQKSNVATLTPKDMSALLELND